MTEYRVSGESESGVESLLPLAEGRFEVRQAVRIDPSVRAGGPTAKIEIGDDDLIEVEFENGFVLWTTVDRLQEDTKRTETRDAGDDLLLATHYPQGGAGGERGFVSNAIKSLKVLGYDLPKAGVRAVAAKVEDRLEGDGKFFRISEKGDLFPAAPPPEPEKPTLVLIHGTASATANAYSGLFSDNSATWSEILEHYDGRVYGFEHRTLSQTPLENALDFLAALPGGANLHLVGHSRGGLVGDLIAHGGVQGDAFAAEDLERELKRIKSDEVREKQRELYQEFNRQIAAKAPRVNRYVRAGCPAAGTTLASGRLDFFLSILINLVRQIPGVGPFVAGFGELVAAAAKERANPEVLPGLEAQMPKSAFIRLLNGSEHVLTSDLTVLAGDSDGLIKNLANLFYWRANDLVVDTRSMYGGARRARRLWHLEENRHVTHVNYFRRFDTAQVVQQGLLRADGDTSGFESRMPKGVKRAHVDQGKPEENVDRPAVILLPGIMGSHLRVQDELEKIDNRVWLDGSDLMKGRGEWLRMGKYSVQPDGVLKLGYDDFRDYLAAQGAHVMPMAYDWRGSLAGPAEELKKLVDTRLGMSTEPVHLIAHSMGGLVASLFIARFRDVWERLRERGGRLVQAGTPNLGSYVIPRILQGTEKMIRYLASFDLSHGKKQWATWTSRFPGLLEMAPNCENDLDFSQKQTWEDLKVLAAPRTQELEKAQEVAQTLRRQRENLAAEGVIYVAGGPDKTPIYDPQEKRIRFTMRGDGRVTWESGIPPGAPLWYVPVKHGSLLDRKSAFAGLRELILNGTTTQLATELPATSSLLTRGEPGGSPELARDDDQIEFIPSSDDLEEAALGMDDCYGRAEKLGPPVPPCEISVVHGDLRFVENPVVVGHYKGDLIVSAESVLDRCLNGALDSRHRLDLYPGDVGTAEAVLKRSDRIARKERGPQGAIVVGLGHVGELTAGGLTRTIEAGLLRYVQTCRDRGDDTSGLRVSALLVGSGEAGIPVAKTVEAFVNAVRQTNRALERLRTGDGEESTSQGSGRDRALASIAHLEFIELFHDVALEAVHALRALPARRDVHLKKTLVSRDAGRRRARVFSPSGWWTRLSIRSDDGRAAATAGTPSRALKFTNFGGRARVPVARVELQGPLVDRFLAEAIHEAETAKNPAPQTLFELLLPLDLKSAAQDRLDLQLVLDEGSAVFPWELMIDRRSEDSEPVGVRAGLLRQLRVADVETVSHPEANQILVVGDPPSALPRLPGARQEADHVASLFERRDWSVLRQIRNESGPAGINASSVISTLLTNDARILHLAGHGVYDPGSPIESGMVIGGGTGDDDPLLLLSPSEVRQMRLQPELVFINCCHLGRIERVEDVPPLHRLAANLAAQFIRSGVKAVVAAGWPVSDLAAATFCDELYAAMFEGAGFGDAVKRARRSTYRKHPETNTWGAYQCYGDPGFRLLMDQEVRARVSGRHYDRESLVDTSELLIELGNLVSRAKVERGSAKEKIGERSEELRSLAERKGWIKERGVLAGVARVHGELGDFERAIDLLEQASGLEEGGVTLKDLEQLANYRVRLAADRKSKSAVTRGIKDLETLIHQHGKTAERCSLLAGSHKRMAQLRTNRVGRHTSLREMTRGYLLAAEFKKDNWWYPATNALLGVLLLGGPWDETDEPAEGTRAAKVWKGVPWSKREPFDEILVQVGARLRQLGHEDFKDFWTAVAQPDFEVVRALANNDLKVRTAGIVAQYRQVMGLYGSGREIDSVIKQWSFAREMAKSQSLESIEKALESFQSALKS